MIFAAVFAKAQRLPIEKGKLWMQQSLENTMPVSLFVKQPTPLINSYVPFFSPNFYASKLGFFASKK